jgi:hypothetical protein
MYEINVSLGPHQFINREFRGLPALGIIYVGCSILGFIHMEIFLKIHMFYTPSDHYICP